MYVTIILLVEVMIIYAAQVTLWRHYHSVCCVCVWLCWQAWDDVQRKIKPPERPYDYQRARPLNQEKSKRSLAEIYEDHYVKQTEVGGRPLALPSCDHLTFDS